MGVKVVLLFYLQDFYWFRADDPRATNLYRVRVGESGVLNTYSATHLPDCLFLACNLLQFGTSAAEALLNG